MSLHGEVYYVCVIEASSEHYHQLIAPPNTLAHRYLISIPFSPARSPNLTDVESIHGRVLSNHLSTVCTDD